MTRVFIAVYFIEAGLVLIAAPWTDWWRRNYFADLLPWLAALMQTRGAQLVVVATGVATAIAGITDLREALMARFSRPATAPHDPDHFRR
jgi:hypothetical protein